MQTDVCLQHSSNLFPAPVFTRHAQCRQAQRSISPAIVELLLASGQRDHDHRGGIRIHLHDRRAQQTFARITDWETLARYKNAYLVVNATEPNVVITVGWCHTPRRTDVSPRHQRPGSGRHQRRPARQ